MRNAFNSLFFGSILALWAGFAGRLAAAESHFQITNKGRTCSAKLYGIRFSVPKDWKLDPATHQDDETQEIFCLGADRNEEVLFYVAYHKKISPGTSAVDFQRAIEQGMSQNAAAFERLPGASSGKSWARGEYRLETGKDVQRTAVSYRVVGPHYLMLHVMASPAAWSRHEKAINAMLKSFQPL